MPRTIAQSDPGAGQMACLAGIEAAVRRVLTGNRFILGAETRTFEEEFARHLGAGFAVGVGTGTDALHLAIWACGIGPGDEVITVSHTSVATVAAIERTGAIPVLVDVDPGTFTMDPAMLPRALSPRTRAVVPVHLYGQPADLGPILAFAADHGLRVIEDCAQSHGALWRKGPGAPWRRAGTAGDAAAFSFYPTKNLGAVGDGGCVTTNDPDLAETVRRLREYGWRERFISERPGWNSRLDELQAAILRVKLRRLDAWNEARGERAAAYDRRLAGSRAVPPQRGPDRTHVFHQYVVRVPDRDRVRAALAAAGVESAIHYPLPIHLQPAYRRLDRPGFLSVTEDLCRSILSLPMHPHLPPDDVAFVAAELRRATARAD